MLSGIGTLISSADDISIEVSSPSLDGEIAIDASPEISEEKMEHTPERFFDPVTRNQEWQNKLSTDLLQLVDPRYHPDAINATESLIEMERVGLVRTIEIENGQHQINVMVHLRPNARFEDIYHYLTDCTQDREANRIAGWIRPEDLKSAALLPDVQMIETVLPPTVAGAAFMYPAPSLSTSSLPTPSVAHPEWEAKLSSDIIQLLNPDARPQGMSREELVTVLKATGVLRINSEYTKTTNSDEILVDVRVREGTGLMYKDRFSHFSYDSTYHRIAGWLPLQNIVVLAQENGVISINTVLLPTRSTDPDPDPFSLMPVLENEFSPDSTGVLSFRNSTGVSGKGVRIGVISDGVTGFDDAIAAGALPSITILRDQIGGSEGVAMMEVIHSIAPDAELIFHDRGQNQIEFVQAIDKLISAGARIICDDITYIEPFFEDGYIASNVRDRILTYGVLYVASAGNMALQHYQNTFSGVEYEGYQWHRFESNPTMPSSLSFRVSAQAAGHVVLQWDDPFGASTKNFELFLYDESGREVGRSVNVQDGNADPIEWVRFYNDSRDEHEYFVRIVQADGNGQATLELFVLPLTGYLVSMDPQTSKDSIFGQQALPEVLCVTAAAFENGAIAKTTYASQGPVTIRYPREEIRFKPDIAAPGTVKVSGSGNFPQIFIGTSAAAPHIAGIAALLMEENPQLSESDIREAIIRSGSYNVEDVESAVHIKDTADTKNDETNTINQTTYQDDFGYGLVNAQVARSLLPSFNYPSVSQIPTILPPESLIHGGITLHPGWNMISVPKNMGIEGMTGADLFPIDTDKRTIWTYNHTAHEWTAVQPDYQVRVCDVFFVYATQSLALQPSNEVMRSDTVPKEIELIAGWNPLGVTGPNAITADVLLQSVADAWSQVLVFDARTQSYRQAIIKNSAGGFSDSRMLYPGEGFWIYMNKPARFSYPAA